MMHMRLQRMTAVVLTGMICILTLFMFPTNSASAATGEYRTWLQGDSRWGSMQLGNSGKTMSSIGCAATTLSKLIVHSGAASEENFDPGVLCTYMSANGGFDSVGNIYWGKITGLIPNFTFEGYKTIQATTLAGKAQEIQSYINQGYYLGVSVKYQGHWVAVDYVSGNTVYIMDPATNKNISLFDSYDYQGVTQIRLFKGPNPPPNSETVTDPVEYFTGHYVTTSNLNLRENAGTGNAIITLIPNQTEVNVIAVAENWGKVNYDGKTGWICLDYTEYIEDRYTYPTGTYIIHVTDGLYVRSGVGSSNKAIGMLANGAVVEVLAVDKGWGKISYNGTDGWICLEYAVYSEGAVAEPEDQPIIGDLNGNGVIDYADVSLLNEYLCGIRNFTAEQIVLADVNADGAISQADSLQLKIYCMNLG